MMDQNQILEQLLGQQMSNDPQWRLMLDLMQQNQTQRAAESEALQTQRESLEARLRKAVLRIKQLQQKLTETEQLLDDLERFQDDLAHALGACPLCWGEEDDCHACRGRGKPGGSTPDLLLFETYILPAWERYHHNSSAFIKK